MSPPPSFVRCCGCGCHCRCRCWLQFQFWGISPPSFVHRCRITRSLHSQRPPGIDPTCKRNWGGEKPQYVMKSINHQLEGVFVKSDTYHLPSLFLEKIICLFSKNQFLLHLDRFPVAPVSNKSRSLLTEIVSYLWFSTGHHSVIPSWKSEMVSTL